MDRIELSNPKDICVWAGCALEDGCVMVAQHGDIIYNVSLNDCEAYSINRLTTDFDRESYMCETVIPYEDKLIFVPLISSRINILNIKTNEIESVKLPDEYIGKVRVLFYCGCVIRSKLYLFGYEMKDILVYDINERKFDFAVLPMSDLELKTNQGGLFARQALTIDDKTYICMLHENKIMTIDHKSEEFGVVLIDDTYDEGFSAMVQYGDDLWLIPYSGNVFYIYNVLEKTVEKINTIGDECTWSYVGGAIYQDELVAIPCYGKKPISIDVKSKTSIVIESLSDYINNHEKHVEFSRPLKIGSNLYICSGGNEEMIEYSMKGKNVRVLHIKLRNLPKNYFYHKIRNENTNIGITELIDLLEQ